MLGHLIVAPERLGEASLAANLGVDAVFLHVIFKLLAGEAGHFRVENVGARLFAERALVDETVIFAVTV